MNFQEYLNESAEAELHIHALLFLLEQDLDALNESSDFEALDEAFDSHLKKIGLKLHKSKGILDYIKSFAKGAGKVIYYIIKGDHDKAKDVLKTMTKEDFLDFLYKLDLGTLHLITGPLHFIDAWSGWDLAVNMASHMKKAEDMGSILKQAIEKVKTAVVNMFTGKQQKNLLSHVDKIQAVAI